MARILVVDDNARLRGAVQDILTQAGYETETASDGDEALQVLGRTPIDLVVTDIVMPEKEGIETITTMRKKYPGLRIIAMSGKGSGDFALYLEMAGEFGADAALPKPFSRAQILEAVESLVGAAKPR